MSVGMRRCIMGGGSSSHSWTSPDSSVNVLVKVPSWFMQRELVVPSSKMTSSQPDSGSNITIAGILPRISSGSSAPPGIISSLKSPGPMPCSKLPKRAASRALIGSSGDPRGAIIGSTKPGSSHSWISPSVPVNELVNEPSAFLQRVPVEPSSNVSDSQPVASSNSNDVGRRSRISSGMSSGNCSPGPPIPKPSSGEVMPEKRSAGSGVRPGPHLWTPPRPSTHSPLPSGQSWPRVPLAYTTLEQPPFGSTNWSTGFPPKKSAAMVCSVVRSRFGSKFSNPRSTTCALNSQVSSSLASTLSSTS